MVTLTLMIFISAIILFFSKEFKNMFKKLFAIPGMPLLLPLFFATLVVIDYETQILWGILILISALQSLVLTVSQWFSFGKISLTIVSILVLMIISLLPVFALEWWVRQRSYRAFHYGYIITAIIWLIVMIFLAVGLIPA